MEPEGVARRWVFIFFSITEYNINDLFQAGQDNWNAFPLELEDFLLICDSQQ